MLPSPFNPSDKSQVADRFGCAAITYHQLATVQKIGAKHLIALTQSNGFQLPEGDVLEIGCGTGFLTQELVNQFQGRSILVTDLSSEMLAFCQAHLHLSPNHNQVFYQQLDGEFLPMPAKPYALIASGFVLQWVSSPIQAIERWLAAIKPGGWLLISFPTDRSFPEWRQICQQFNLPFTLNPLPDADILLENVKVFPVRCFTNEIVSQTLHQDAIDFLKSLKVIGAGSSLTGKQLSVSQLKQLSSGWKAQIHGKIHDKIHGKMVVSHSIAYWAIQRIN